MSSKTIVLIGGHGGMGDRYRTVAKEQGLDLRHFEHQLPGKLQSALRNISMVIVIAGMVSHPLREQAQRLAERDGAPIIYLRTASVSALRKVLPGAGAAAQNPAPATRRAA